MILQQNSFIDNLGAKNSYEVVMCHKAWLEEVMDDPNKYYQHENHCSATMSWKKATI